LLLKAVVVVVVAAAVIAQMMTAEILVRFGDSVLFAGLLQLRHGQR
jgi:hypothetical protein